MARKNKNPVGFTANVKSKKKLFQRRSRSATHIGFGGDLKQKEVKTPFRDRWRTAQDSTRAGVGGFQVVLTIIFFVLLVTVLTRTLTGVGGVPTMASLLERLQSAPSVEIPYISMADIPLSGDDWGVLEFIRVTIVYFLQSLNISVFFVNGLISVVSYVIFIFTWLFVG